MIAAASIIRSATSIPWGPPNPRNAVFDTVVRAHAPGADPRRRVVVGVVRVEHGPVVHAGREVGGTPAARVEIRVDAREHAAVVESAAPVHAEVVALAGHRHVVVAVEPDLGRAAGDARGEGGEAGPLRRLGLLAAEPPAHPPALAHHGGVGRAEHAGDEVLHLGGVLGRGVDPHLVVLAGHRERGLSLEIEVFLAADAHPAVESMRGGGDRGLGAPRAGTRREGITSAPSARPSSTVTRGGRAATSMRARRAARRAASRGRRDDREDHLPVEEDLARGEDRVVAEGGAAIVLARDVRRRQDRRHPRGGAHRVEVHRADRAARRAGGAGGDVQGARRLREVVDVGGGPLHVAGGAVVGEGEADARSRVESRPVRDRGVGDRGRSISSAEC